VRLSLRIIQVLLPQQLGPRSTPTAEEDYLSLVLFWILLGKAKKAPTAESNAIGYAHAVHLMIDDTQLMEKLYNVANDLLLQFKRNPKQGEAAATATTETRVPGALLTERTATVTPVVSASTFSAVPFFSDTYARSHKDLFQDFPKILSEVVLRLVLAIYSCASKQDQPIILNNRKSCIVLLCCCICLFSLQSGNSCCAISFRQNRHPLCTSTARGYC
jgi:hypothetical protein